MCLLKMSSLDLLNIKHGITYLWKRRLDYRSGFHITKTRIIYNMLANISSLNCLKLHRLG